MGKSENKEQREVRIMGVTSMRDMSPRRIDYAIKDCTVDGCPFHNYDVGTNVSECRFMTWLPSLQDKPAEVYPVFVLDHCPLERKDGVAFKFYDAPDNQQEHA